MKFTADTNVILRYLLNDDEKQAAIARRMMQNAGLIAVTLPVLCEVVWTLLRGYKMAAADIAVALEALTESKNVKVKSSAVAAGIALLCAEGDFADGVIAHEDRSLGGKIFIFFDKQAVALLNRRGKEARLLS